MYKDMTNSRFASIAALRAADIKAPPRGFDPRPCLVNIQYVLNVVLVAVRNVRLFPNFSYMYCLIVCVCGADFARIYFAYSDIRLVLSNLSIWVQTNRDSNPRPNGSGTRTRDRMYCL